MQAHPTIVHTWHDKADVVGLRIPATSPDGCDVELVAEQESLVLYAGQFHMHIDHSRDSAVLVRDAFGLVRDLLSPAMRLRELRAGKMAYRWFLEVRDGNGWTVEHETGLLLWNFLGKRSERVYQNRHLPAREV